MGVGTFQGASVPLPALASQQLGNRELLFAAYRVCVCVRRSQKAAAGGCLRAFCVLTEFDCDANEMPASPAAGSLYALACPILFRFSLPWCALRFSPAKLRIEKLLVLFVSCRNTYFSEDTIAVNLR